MSPTDITESARIPLFLLRWAEQQGVDPAELTHLAGITENELSDPDARVSIGKTWELWRVLIERFDEPNLGLKIGSQAKTRDFGLLGYAIYFSRTAEGAFLRAARYGRVVSGILVADLILDEERGSFTIESVPPFDTLRHPIDAMLASSLALCQEITEPDVVPLEVRLPYPRPADDAEHRRVFRAPLKFEQRQAMLVFRRDDLQRRTSAADEALSGILDHLAEEKLEELRKSDTLAKRVRYAIWPDLSRGKPSVQRVATHLGISRRTLQRRLEEEGTSFSAELERLRQEMATTLLRDPKLAVYEVAFLLGYQDPSTFFQAFRRWKDMSPQEYRRSVS